MKIVLAKPLLNHHLEKDYMHYMDLDCMERNWVYGAGVRGIYYVMNQLKVLKKSEQ